MKSDYAFILSALRRERSLSQRRVADDLGISQALLSHYENGVREPRFDFVVKVCDYYGVSADYFFGRTDEKSYDGKYILPCPGAAFEDAMRMAAKALSALCGTGSADLLEAAAGYLGVYIEGVLRHIREPFSPADPAFDASLKTAEAVFLSAVRRASEDGLLSDTPDSPAGELPGHAEK